MTAGNPENPPDAPRPFTDLTNDPPNPTNRTPRALPPDFGFGYHPQPPNPPETAVLTTTDAPTITTAPPAAEHLTRQALELALPTGADARAVLVPEWALEHLIESQDAAGTRTRALALPTRRLVQLSADLDLTFPDDGDGLSVVLAEPDPEELQDTPPAQMLVRYWRLLFYA
ncbi:MAG: hypothetical protein ACAI43_19870, partial [Phycisphaerae bacterium]